MVCGLTDLAGAMVRPRWQPCPPKMPDARMPWCAFGIINQSSPGYTAWHDRGVIHVQTDERLVVLFSFYGPGALSLARALRDGLYVEQNRAMLRQGANLALVSAGDIVAAPELVNMKWIRRQDIQITFVRGPLRAEGSRPEEGRTDIRDLLGVDASGLCGRTR